MPEMTKTLNNLGPNSREVTVLTKPGINTDLLEINTVLLEINHCFLEINTVLQK